MILDVDDRTVNIDGLNSVVPIINSRTTAGAMSKARVFCNDQAGMIIILQKTLTRAGLRVSVQIRTTRG